MMTRQLWVELYGLPGYGKTLDLPKAAGIAVQPRDFRPVDEGQGKTVLAGRFLLAGSGMDAAAPGDPWNRPSPTRAFATELHAYAWLPAMMTQSERGAREALRLTLIWDRVFRRWSPFAWGPRVLARRVFNLACAAKKIAAIAGEPERDQLALMLARQARQLLRPPGGLDGRSERLVAAAVAGAALAGKPGASIRKVALGRLPRALTTEVGEDGGHRSRSPEAGLELLFDLLTLDDVLAQISETPPPELAAAIQRLQAGLKVLTLADGRLAAFQGGGPSSVKRVAAACPPDAGPPSREPASVAGLTRIASPLMQVIADVAAPARNAWADAACAQPLALEIVCGRDRLISNAGWTPRALERQALRLTPAGSTLTLAERSLGEPLSGKLAEQLGPRLHGPALEVTSDLREGDGAIWLEIEHDGWVKEFGLKHQRRLYLDQRLDELRAEERLYPPPGHGRGESDRVRPIAAPYALRFHLEPGVGASLARDRRSILLRGHSGRGWWFRTDGPDVAIEPSVHIDEGLTRRSLQIVVRGSVRTDAESRIRWKLSPAGGAEDPV